MRTPTGLICHPFVTENVIESGVTAGYESRKCWQYIDSLGWRNGKRRGHKSSSAGVSRSQNPVNKALDVSRLEMNCVRTCVRNPDPFRELIDQIFDIAGAFVAGVEVWDDRTDEVVTMAELVARRMSLQPGSGALRLLPKGSE